MPIPAGSSPVAPPTSGPLVYDPVLSRVRITGVTYLNANPYFETNAAGWTAADGTIARSTAQFHEGGASLLLTPDGVGAGPRAEMDPLVPVTAGETYGVSAWVRCAVARSVELQITWFTAAGAFVTSSSNALPASVAANTWTFGSGAFVAPPTAAQASIRIRMTGTPPPSHLLHIDEATFGPSLLVERSTDQVTWAVVRGATDLPVGTFTVSDYEFSAGVLNYYRTPGWVGSITPTLDGVWLKSLARPFLNRQVTVRDFSDVARRSRAGVFDVVGRSYPVAVTDVRGSRQWTLDVNTYTEQERSDLDLLLASGDILLVQVPQGAGRVSAVPGGYVTVGDAREVTPPTYDLAMRVFSLPCTEVATPGPDVVGAESNWQTVLNTYSTWEALLVAHASWASVLELVGDPEDVIVS